MDWIIALIGSLFSGIIGVAISNWYHNKNEKRRAKLKLLEELLGSRYDIIGDKFTQSLNKIFVVFYDNPSVVQALKNFYENTMSLNANTELANEKLLELFKSMCLDLKINTQPLTDSFFLRPFNVRNH